MVYGSCRLGWHALLHEFREHLQVPSAECAFRVRPRSPAGAGEAAGRSGCCVGLETGWPQGSKCAVGVFCALRFGVDSRHQSTRLIAAPPRGSGWTPGAGGVTPGFLAVSLCGGLQESRVIGPPGFLDVSSKCASETRGAAQGGVAEEPEERHRIVGEPDHQQHHRHQERQGAGEPPQGRRRGRRARRTWSCAGNCDALRHRLLPGRRGWRSDWGAALHPSGQLLLDRGRTRDVRAVQGTASKESRARRGHAGGDGAQYQAEEQQRHDHARHLHANPRAPAFGVHPVFGHRSPPGAARSVRSLATRRAMEGHTFGEQPIGGLNCKDFPAVVAGDQRSLLRNPIFLFVWSVAQTGEPEPVRGPTGSAKARRGQGGETPRRPNRCGGVAGV